MFDCFVVFAEMRTGSNFLEANLNEFGDLVCHGEVFNPHFIGHHKTFELFGLDMAQREADPIALIDAMKAEKKAIPGFRFFNDHDPRVMSHVLADKRCAKIILTRNPLDSYVSLKIAGATGQWKLSDMKQRRGATIEFDDTEFREHLAAKTNFQLDILRGLQLSGQTAFYVAYEDIQDLDVINGLATWLGSKSQLPNLSKATKRQNPSSLEEKVSNFSAMQRSLASMDHFSLGRTPNFEPRRGPAVPGFVLSNAAPLLYIPIQPVPSDRIVEWMNALGDGGTTTDLSQKSLRSWMKENPDHRSFTVLSHPLERAYSTFCRQIFPKSEGRFAGPRRVMRNRYGVSVPNPNELDTYSIDDHREAFAKFLEFLKGNLAEQTSVRIDPTWATQTAILEGATTAIIPDIILRQSDAAQVLNAFAEKFDVSSVDLAEPRHEQPYDLKDIYDQRLEKLCLAAYRKDYVNFGFGEWQ